MPPETYMPGTVRERSIPDKVVDALNFVGKAHEILDRLDGTANKASPAGSLPESLVQSSALLSERSAALVGRLETLFG